VKWEVASSRDDFECGTGDGSDGFPRQLHWLAVVGDPNLELIE
jgi:hypothetical protein